MIGNIDLILVSCVSLAFGLGIGYLIGKKPEPKKVYAPRSDRHPVIEYALDLEGELLACRDAFPTPKVGDPIHELWADTIDCPLQVPDYIRARAKQLAEKS